MNKIDMLRDSGFFFPFTNISQKLIEFWGIPELLGMRVNHFATILENGIRIFSKFHFRFHFPTA